MSNLDTTVNSGSDSPKSRSLGFEKALKFLKIRPHHSAELVRKLKMRGFGGSEISETIDTLASQGLLNDHQFAQDYLASLLAYKTFGYYGLKAKLMSRGIASNEADSLLKENLPIERELELAQKFALRFGQADKVRLAQKLSRKGFRSAVIAQIVQNMV